MLDLILDERNFFEYILDACMRRKRKGQSHDGWKFGGPYDVRIIRMNTHFFSFTGGGVGN
jgi:hypothetical protein